jgi:hypothetical protein
MNLNEFWELDPDGTSDDSWLELKSDCGNKQHWWHASVRSDGCIHFKEAVNVPYGLPFGDSSGKGDRPAEAHDQYMHICDLEELIYRLIALLAAAREHFGKDWPP